MIARLFWWLPFGSVPEISAEDLTRRLHSEEEIELLDVRTSLEFGLGHIPGARSVPIHRLPGEIESLLIVPDATVVAVCKTAHRSIPAVRLLRRYGYQACQLEGGMDRWRKLGLRLAEGPTKAEAGR